MKEEQLEKKLSEIRLGIEEMVDQYNRIARMWQISSDAIELVGRITGAKLGDSFEPDILEIKLKIPAHGLQG